MLVAFSEKSIKYIQIIQKSFHLLDLGRFVGFLLEEHSLFYNYLLTVYDVDTLGGISNALASEVVNTPLALWRGAGGEALNACYVISEVNHEFTGGSGLR